jgi:aminopeptidase C
VEDLCNVSTGYPIARGMVLIFPDVNASIESLEDAVIAGIKANTPLFFGCDVGKASNTKEGVMDTQVYNLELAYGYKLNLTKAQRLQMGESSVSPFINYPRSGYRDTDNILVQY